MSVRSFVSPGAPDSRQSAAGKPVPAGAGGSAAHSAGSSGHPPCRPAAEPIADLRSELNHKPTAANASDAVAGDLVSEGLITLSEAARYCPRRRQGRKTHVTTIGHWVRHGSRGVYLEAIDTPSGLATSLPAIKRFFSKLTAARNLPRQQPEQPHSEERHEAVEAELARRFRI